MKIIISGGHFSPALSIIEELMGRKHEVLVIGRKTALEGDGALSYEYVVCTQRKIPFKTLEAGRLQRKLTRHTISSILKIPLSLLRSYSILKDFKPNAVLVFGGYVAIPIAYAARLLKIPIFIHEQTTQASFANKHIASFAKKIFISFESSKAFFPKDKVIVTGNPLRKEIFEVKKIFPIPSAKHVLYITGGSTGSHFINTLIEKLLEKLLPETVVIHQTGDSEKFKDFERLLKVRDRLSPDLKKRYILKKFIFPDEVGWIYKKSDLIISRSGINSVCEYMALGKIALLIPLPHGQNNEQLLNAKYYQNKALLGSCIEQKNCEENTVFSKITLLLNESDKLLRHAEGSKKLIPLSASKKIVDELQFLNETS